MEEQGELRVPPIARTFAQCSLTALSSAGEVSAQALAGRPERRRLQVVLCKQEMDVFYDEVPREAASSALSEPTQMLHPSGCMTASTTTTLPQPDRILFDPAATASRPALATVSQVQAPSTTAAMTDAVLSAHPAKFDIFANDRPVKRSTRDTALLSPPNQRDAGSVVLPQKKTLFCMRSPPPLAKQVCLGPKRALDAPLNATGHDRPCKRVNTGSSFLQSASKQHSSVPSVSPSKQPVHPKYERSEARSAVSAFTTVLLKDEPNTKSIDTQLFALPSVGSKDVPQKASKPVLTASKANTIPSPASTSAKATSLLSLSPSKFGLSIPQKCTLTRRSPISFASSSLAVTQGSTKTSSIGLAPSPLRSDEHVPCPSDEPILTLPSRRSSLQRTTSLNASPSRVNPVFGNPFLQTEAGRARLSGGVPNHVPGSPQRPVTREAPSRSAASPARTSTKSSLSPRPASPMTRDDLMRRTLEKASPVYDATQDAYSSQNSEDVAQKLQADNNCSRQIDRRDVEDLGSMNHRRTAEASTSGSLVQSLHSGLGSRTRSPASAYQSLGKRPASPTLDNDMMKHQDKKRHPCTDAGSHSRRQSLRQATKASCETSKVFSATSETALSHQRPRISSKSRHDTAEARDDIAQYRPSSAGGSAPITRPASFRSCSAPSMTVSHVMKAEQDVFKAPSLALALPAPSAFKLDVPMDEGDTGDTLDGDTSVMSTSGLSSLANLQSLLSRMSRPSMSRRTSAAFPQAPTSLTRLPEQAEGEEGTIGSASSATGQTGPSTRPIAGLPRYAAPTSSSAARQSKGSNGPGEADAVTYDMQAFRAKEPRKRTSRGVPEVRRGSLLPMAVNAAQRITVRPDPVATNAKPDAPALKVSKAERCSILKDVVAFVDVKTAEGDEAGGVFVDILRNLGARVRWPSLQTGIIMLTSFSLLQVLARPTDSVTHIIFKGGRAATVQRYRAYTKEPKPFFVGVGWIVRCRELNEKVDETGFLVNPDTVDTGVLLKNSHVIGQKKAMLPLAASSGNVSRGAGGRRHTLEPKVLFPGATKKASTSSSGQLTLAGETPTIHRC